MACADDGITRPAARCRSATCRHIPTAGSAASAPLWYTGRMAMVGIRFDLRVPSFAKTTHAEMYEACLDQGEWADRLGLDILVLSEHHGVEDGFMSSPVTLAAAIAGRTKNDPDQHRRDPGAAARSGAPRRAARHRGAGQRRPRRLRRRARLPRRGVRDGGRRSQAARHAARGSASRSCARRGPASPSSGAAAPCASRPAPPSPPMILIGGSTEKAAKRAAKLRAGFFPAIGDQRLADLYTAECERLGFHGGFVSMPNGPGFVHVSEDPERDWQRIAPHVTLRRADLRLLADRRPALADARRGPHPRRRQAERRLHRPHPRRLPSSSPRTPAASSSTR